ncbi:hypothetical protein GN157_17355 [Flavobacterium rakeshii]|uniref:Uncharacterized protein n=1 Tax=Flavobacterium rakeshii TaxID=1038845 RepID=A0A6N8HI92_9FLAO|nr:hypothetical protein [Flavobacterium rakeshii]MEE1899102.1 hypothetical protein [Flavobacterium rakeshii]MUV05484.1 hypothetical protein [Flavobacterium rakeshii]
MKKAFKTLLSLSAIALLTVYLFVFSNIVFPWQKDNAIKTTLEWSGLTELPIENKNINITKRGSMFTRQYILEFTANTKEIKNWIKKNKKLNKIQLRERNNTKTYVISGEKGAIGGTVKIKDNLVIINMSWS